MTAFFRFNGSSIGYATLPVIHIVFCNTKAKQVNKCRLCTIRGGHDMCIICEMLNVSKHALSDFTQGLMA